MMWPYLCILHFTDYVDSLMQKTLQYCKSDDDDDKPTLPTAPPPLASAYTHPDKDTIPLFSRYKKWLHWTIANHLYTEAIAT